VDYFFLTFLLEEERLTLEREELELREERLTVDRDELELREERLTLEREELTLRLGVEILLLEDDRELTELLEGVREVDLWTELDEAGRRMVLLEEEEEKRFTILLVFVFDVLSDLVLFVEDEDLNLEGTIPFPRVEELLDVTDFCEFGVYLLMTRDEIPDFKMSPELLTRLDCLLITPELLRLELGVRTDVDFTLERELIVFPEE